MKNCKNDRVTLRYKWITKKVYILPRRASWSRSASRPSEGMGVGVSLALRSILDLSWIDLIPVNNKKTQSVMFFLKKRLSRKVAVYH